MLHSGHSQIDRTDEAQWRAGVAAAFRQLKAEYCLPSPVLK